MRNPDTQIYNTISELIDWSTRQTYPTWTTTSTSERWTHSSQVVDTSTWASPWTDTSEWPFWPFGVSWTSWGWVNMWQNIFEEILNREERPETTIESMHGSWLSVMRIDIIRIPTSLHTRLLITLSNWYGFAEELEDRELFEFECGMMSNYEWVPVEYLIDILRDIRKKPPKSFTQWFITNLYNEKSIKE